MTYKRNHAAEFFAKGLNLISIALYLARPDEYQQLKKILHEVTGIDLGAKNVLDNMDEQLHQTLIDFEKDHSNLLLGIILSTELDDPFHIKANNELAVDKQISRTYTFRYWIGAVILFVSFLYIFGVTFLPIPPVNQRLADTILGLIIGGGMQQVTNFYFSNGTSLNEFKTWQGNNRNNRNDRNKKQHNP